VYLHLRLLCRLVVVCLEDEEEEVETRPDRLLLDDECELDEVVVPRVAPGSGVPASDFLVLRPRLDDVEVGVAFPFSAKK
jgi:hypothetical protein